MSGSITAQEFYVWWDRVSMPNRALTFLHEIRDAVERADCLVLVVGPGAIESDYVRAEWQHALEYCKPVHPVLRLGDYKLLPTELELLDTPDFCDDDQYGRSLEHLLRHLKEPVAPLGRLVAVPELTPHYLPRPNDLKALKQLVLADIQKPVVVTSTARRLGLHGMGGIGKSVLAAALARDCEIRRAFPDGVLWVPIGQSPSLTLRQYDVCLALGSPPPHPFADEHAGKAHLSTVLMEKRCLLILDDIWQVEHAQAFDVLGPRCKMLLSTRDAALISALGAHEHRLDILSKDNALALMVGWFLPDDMPETKRSERIAQLRTDLPEPASDVARECGYLPLALALSAAQVRDGTPWEDLLDALREADLEFFDHPHGSILKSLKVSIDALQQANPGYVRHYLELAVFPEGTLIPEATILTLWLHIGGINERRARQLIQVLARKALIRATGEQPNRQIELHDLQHTYLRQALEDLNAVHDELIQAYWQKCPNGWHTGPNDGYFFDHLAYHLREAGRLDDLRALFANQDWMHIRFQHKSYTYAGYLQDLAIAWHDIAHVQVLAQIEAGKAPAALTDCVRYALIETSINSLSGNYIPELVARSVETGLWSVNRALSVAQLVPDTLDRIKMYAALLKTASLKTCERSECQDRAIGAVLALKDPRQLTHALKASVMQLEGDSLRQGFEAILTIESEWERAEILVAMAGQLKGELLMQGLKVALSLGDDGDRAFVLAALSRQLAGQQKVDVLHQALEMALALENEWIRLPVLVVLAEQLEGKQKIEVLRQALADILALSDDEAQTRSLVMLAEKLEGETVKSQIFCKNGSAWHGLSDLALRHRLLVTVDWRLQP